MKVNSVRIESHVDEVIEEMKKKLNAGLVAIGLDASSTAAKYAPVDTGLLKNSINWAITSEFGEDGDEPMATPEEGTLYIGTNVEYAPYQEFGTNRGIPGKHFIQHGCTAHMSEYQKMIEDIMKE